MRDGAFYLPEGATIDRALTGFSASGVRTFIVDPPFRVLRSGTYLAEIDLEAGTACIVEAQ